jgi:hypothetical protein
MAIPADQGEPRLRDTLLGPNNMRYALAFITNVKNSKAVACMIVSHGGDDGAVMTVFNGAKAAPAGCNVMVRCREAAIGSTQRQTSRAQSREAAR